MNEDLISFDERTSHKQQNVFPRSNVTKNMPTINLGIYFFKKKPD